jgi:hypothetical protein
MGDALIQEQIRDAFQEIYQTVFDSLVNNDGEESKVRKPYSLTFTIGGKTFSGNLTVEASKYYFSFIAFKLNIGSCIDSAISIPLDGTESRADSSIGANSPTKGCFRPTLTSERESGNSASRFTATDVLQILKTKLTYLMPLPEGFRMDIKDEAIVRNVPMTYFNVLRGKAPFYRKYGYTYENIELVQAYISTVTWGQLKDMPYPYETIATTFGDVIPGITGLAYNDSDSIETVMKTVSFDQESRFNLATLQEHDPQALKFWLQTSRLNLSSAVLLAISKLEGYPPGASSYLSNAYHDPNSPEWKASSARLQITEFAPLVVAPVTGPVGGKRKRKTHRHRKQKKQTKRFKKSLKA